MNKRLKANLATTALTSILLGGCSLGVEGQAERAVEGNTRIGAQYLDQARQPPLVKGNTNIVQVDNDVYTVGTARRNDHGEPLPRRFDIRGGFTLTPAATMKLYEIGTAITEATGIPVTFAPDVYSDGGFSPRAAVASAPVGSSAGNAAPAAVQVGPGGVPLPPAPSSLGSRGPQDLNSLLSSIGVAGNTTNVQGGQILAVEGTREAMKINFHGRISDFMNQVASHFGVTWEYTGGTIRVFRNVTRTYTVNALPSSIALQSTMTAEGSSAGSSGSSGAGASGTSNQKVTSDISIKIWDDISSTVKSMVGASGQVATAVSTGTITVTAPEEVVARVQSYIDVQNARLSKLVAVSVQVLSVTLNNSDNYTLDIAGLVSKSATYGLAFGNTAASAAVQAASGGTAALAGAIAANSLTSTAPGLGLGIVRGSSNGLGGSNAVVAALSTMGRVSLLTTTSVTTLNGVPAPVQVANTRGYLERVSVTQGTGTSGGTQTQLTPGSVTTGYNLALLPRVTDDGQSVLLQFGINISELNGKTDGFDIFSSGGQTIQLPNVNSRNFVQQASIPSGATLVLAGFEQLSEKASKSGTGSPDFVGLGGGQQGTRQRDEIVILLTPQIYNSKMIDGK